MRIKVSLVTFLMILISTEVIAPNAMDYQDKATEDVANLVKKRSLSDDEQRGGYLNKLKNMTIEHPSNKNIKNMYANILLTEKKYPPDLNQ